MMSEIRAERLSVKYCQQDPLRTSVGGLFLSGQIPALPSSHLLLLFSSIPALKKETGMQTDERAQSILAHWKGGPSSFKPLACRHRSCWGIKGVTILSGASCWAVSTFGLILHMAKLSGALQPKKVFRC